LDQEQTQITKNDSAKTANYGKDTTGEARRLQVAGRRKPWQTTSA